VGDGLKAENSTLTASRIVVDNLRGVGVDFTNSVVTATRMRLSDIDDTAMYVLAGSRLTASELAFTGTMTAALRTGAADATLRDVVFRISGTEPEVFTGARGGETTFERMAAVGDGTLLLFDGVGLTLRDSSIVGQASSDSAESSAIVAFGGSSILLERTSIRRVWSVAVAAAELGSELVATDVVIRADAEGAVDHAIEVGEGAHAALTRVFVAGVDGIGVLATDEGTTVSAEDLVVRETQSNSGGLLGRALQIQRGAHLSGQRVHCAANHEVAVVAGALAATVDLSDVIIEGTRERGCTAPGCAGAGIGLGAYLGGHISLNRFRIMGSALAGAQLAMDGEIDLSDGVISGNPVGVNVQSPDFDLARLTSGVLFQDNGINLDADELPLPAATTR